MNEPAFELETSMNSDPSSHKSKNKFLLKLSSCSEKVSIYYFLALSFVILVLIQILSLQTSSTSPWEIVRLSTCHKSGAHEIQAMTSKLREAVTFLPLKDLRYANTAMYGHTWFMSSLNDTHEEGEARYQQYPTKSSGGRVLCLKGRDPHDGSWNSYALAWPKALPHNATLMDGTTYVAYNYYDYGNIWHGLLAVMPFVRWHIKSQCVAPKRWIFYYWGELRTSISPWVETLLQATFGAPLNIEKFDYHGGSDGGDGDDGPRCFEEAVVMRHNEGGMSNEKKMEVYELMRCKARMFCNVSSRNDEGSGIGMTMLMRDGGRSYKNASAVIGIFEKECRKVVGCRLMLVYPHNLTFCEQVKLMSLTDILISAHGAQLSNMILMDTNSSVMELFPKGWLELAGIGQYVYHNLASWSGMIHQGVWRDPDGEPCPYPETDPRCMSVFKNGKIGHNETYFSEWAKNVLDEVKMRKGNREVGKSHVYGLCVCE